MSVEGGGIGGIGVTVSAGSSLNVRFGPSISGPESIPRLLSSVVNEGPAGRSFLDNTMPLYISRFSPVGEINFKPVLSGFQPIKPKLDSTAAIVEAEQIVSQAQQPLQTKEVIAEAEHWLGIDKSKSVVIPTEREEPTSVPLGFELKPRVVVAPAPYIHPEVVPWPIIQPVTKTEKIAGMQVAGQPRTEVRAVGKVAQAVAIQPAPKEQEQEVEEIVEERVQQEVEEGLEEGQIVERRRYLKDEEALSQRKKEIRQAVIKARTEVNRLGLEKIAGWLVAKFLPAEHEGNRSEIVKKTGPDGSYQETVEAVAGAGEFESEERAAATFYQTAEDKKPVRVGKEGKPVENQDIARVYKYKIVKPVQPFVEVITRTIKKRVSKAGQSSIPIAESVKVEGKSETSLEDYPQLAEACLAGRRVFPKAA